MNYEEYLKHVEENQEEYDEMDAALDSLNKSRIDHLFDLLEVALIGMDIPKERMKDIGWLNRNIHVNNSNHPNLEKANWTIKNIMKEQNG